MATDPNAPTLPDSDSPNGGSPASASGAGQKVELDMDDAPFLEDDEPEAEEEKEEHGEPDEVMPPPVEKPASFMQRLLANKKRLFLAGGAFVFLVAAAIGATIFLGGEKAPPPPPGPVERTEQLPEGPPPLPEAPLPKHVMSFEPFWVEQRDTEGNIRFLSLTFAVPTDNDMLFAELNGKKLTLRDALFYYLSRRPLIMLQDEKTMATLKADLMTVINEHVANGKVNDIFIESYLVQ